MPSTFHHGRPTIGVVAGWQYYWTATPLSYLNPIYHGIRVAAQEQGCNLLLGCGLGPSAAASDPLRRAWPVLSPEADFVPIGPWNTTGLIAVCPLHSAARSHDLQQIMASGHPLVFVGSGEAGPTVAADNIGGIYAALAHLVEHGHRQIAFIAGSPEDLAGDTGARLNAYYAALQSFGFTSDARLVAYGRHITDGGYTAMRQILNTGAPFSAVLASNDESALGAMQALREAGLRIPADVALIGFDDRPESAVQEPPLTTVHIPLFDMGYRTLTHALLTGSPARDAADVSRCPATDQRNVARSQGVGCDIGAYEAPPPPTKATIKIVLDTQPDSSTNLSFNYVSWHLAHIVLDKFDQVTDKLQSWAVSVLAGLIMVMWDMSMDPARSTLGEAWIWHEGGGYFGVPFENFMGWFLYVWTIFQLYAFYLHRQAGAVTARAKADDHKNH